MMKHRFIKKLSQYAPAILFCIALFIIYKQLETHEFSGLLKHWNNIPWTTALIACVLTLINYLLLSFYDVLALRTLGYKSIAYPKILFTSFISFAISNNTGHAWASGGSIRYRFYQKLGVQGWDIAKISAFLSLTFFVGMMTLGLFSIILAPHALLNDIDQTHIFYVIFWICIVFLLAYWGSVLFIKNPIKIKNFSFELPTPRIAFLQTLLASIDLILASSILWLLLKDISGISFESFLVNLSSMEFISNLTSF